MELSRSAGGFNHPPDRQAETLREIARQQANANTWNMIQTGVMAAQLAAQSAIHDQMEEVKRQNENALAIQQELLNREQLQQYLEEFIFQTEKLVADFSLKSDVPASTRYFLLLSVVVQVEQDGIDTATIRGRDNKTAFERAMASVNRLVAELLKDPEVQDAIKWAEKEEAKRAEKRAKRLQQRQSIEVKLNDLRQQRDAIARQRNPVTYGEAFQKWFESRKGECSGSFWRSYLYLSLALSLFPFMFLMVYQQQQKLNADANVPIDYQLSTLDNRIAALESELLDLSLRQNTKDRHMAANWHYAKGGEKHGPITSAQLKEMAAKGQLSPDDLVWREDMKEWRKASTVKGLFSRTGIDYFTAATSAVEQNGKTDEVAIWERPAILALLTVCCFPVGLILVWKNARMTTKEKGLWTAACGGVIALLFLFNTFMTQGVEKDLARANTLWAEGKQPEAVALYQAVLNNRDMYIPDDQKPLVYGRVIDHLAKAGNEKEIKPLVEKVNRSHPPFEPLVETEKGRAVLAKYAAPQESDDENDEWKAMELMAKHVIDDLKAKGYPDTNVEQFNALMRQATNSLGPDELPNGEKWNQVEPTDFKEFQSEDDLQGKIVSYGPFVKITFVKSRRTGDWNFIVARINATEYGGPKHLGF